MIPIPPGTKPAGDPDPVLQRTFARASTLLAPTPGLNFEGLGTGIPGFNIAGAPPDTNGAAGLTQYVQWVNLSFAVFDKSTGAMILGPAAGNSLWQGFGGSCENTNDGDPIVLYDRMADRWILSQFAIRTPGVAGSVGPFFQCVAVSTTPDATGTYNRYAFQYSLFDDYPKMGVWPDAYYVTFNMFNAATDAFMGADVCAYDRTAMLAGRAATQICFQQGTSIGGLLPSDMDGRNPPPAGSPNFMIFFGANVLNLFKFRADFVTPENSTFTGPTVIPVAPFTALCNGGTCVPQPNTATLLDSLADRLMYRLAYRNFGDHESLVVNHAVAVGATAYSAGGVRWYELQNPNGTPVVAQQSTFAPDSNSFRWMGSIAMDQVGDIALGYSLGGSNIFPSIAMAARAAADPAGTMGPEMIIVNGTGSQTAKSNGTPLIRWGDYSAMQIDPSDDCTFWYTTEYIKDSGIFNWNTRIASFKFPGCDQPDLAISGAHTGDLFVGQTGASYTINIRNVGALATAGGTVSTHDILGQGLTATAASGPGWSCNSSFPTTVVLCSRPAGTLEPGASYPPITLTLNVAPDAPANVLSSLDVGGIPEFNFVNNIAYDTLAISRLAVICTGSDSATVIAGNAAAFSFSANLATNPPLGTVTFNVTGLPPNSSASLAPSLMTQSGILVLTINTSGNGHLAGLQPVAPGRFGLARMYLRSFAVFLPFAGIAGLILMRRTRGKSWPLRALSISSLAFLIFVGFSGCGGGSSSSTAASITPPGTYEITMTATSSNVSIPPVVTRLTLAVR